MKISSNEIGVYQIKNLKSGLVYVGSTRVSFRKRFNTHIRDLKRGNHSNSHLQRSWTKYGENSFIVEILEVVIDPAKVLSREQYWIDRRGQEVELANFHKIAGSPLGIKHTPETMKSCVTDTEKKAMIDAYLSGLSVKKSAAKMGRSCTVLTKILMEAGIPIRGPHAFWEPFSYHKEIVDLYLKGESCADLGRRFGCPTWTCENILKRAGVSKRPLGRRRACKDWTLVESEYLNGAPTACLGKKYNVSPSTISNYLKARGVKMRRSGPQSKATSS